jgi:hypothetical protein
MIIVIANFIIMFVFNIDPAYLHCPSVECAEDNRNVMHQRVVVSSSVAIQYEWGGNWREAKLELQGSVTNDKAIVTQPKLSVAAEVPCSLRDSTHSKRDKSSQTIHVDFL